MKTLRLLLVGVFVGLFLTACGDRLPDQRMPASESGEHLIIYDYPGLKI